jgi:nucleoside-diphosphate-sugar epimerase
MLLKAGYQVRGTVRRIGSESSKHLTVENLVPEGDCPGTLTLVEANLLAPGSFDAHAAGCTYVIHMASPFLTSKSKDPQRDLIDPAVKGTENVLNAVNLASTVKRVVLTSSVAAIMDSASDKPEGEPFSEEDWNEFSSLKRSPYSYSKTLAERRATEMQAETKTWDLVCINPGLVLGPMFSSRENDGSITTMKKFVDGSLKIGIPLSFGIVDVRDVARAHILAMEKPGAQGRHLCVAEVMSLKQIGDAVTKNHPQFPGVKHVLPKALMYIVGPLVLGMSLKGVSRMGRTPNMDNTKIQKELGIKFITIQQSVDDMLQSMEVKGMLPAK